MPSQETGKTRAQRIQLDYHRQPDPLNRVRWLCVLIAIVAAGAYALFVMWPAGATHVSPGPLAMAHAAFENDCSQCHGDGWRMFTEASNDWQVACQECHFADGHFASRLTDAKQADERDCSSCHRDHQGRMHNLVQLTDHACQLCHEQLAKAVSQPPPRVRAEIQRFSLDSHGDFRSLQIDSGKIRFHHQQHLQPGQVAAGVRGGFRLEMLPDRWRDVYRKAGQADDDFVELNCQDCHQSGRDLALRNAADADLGRYYAPISFDRHCAACHSLNYAGQTKELLPLPHAVPWHELETILASKITGGRVTGRIREPSDAAQKEPLPGSGIVAPSKPGADLTDLQMRRMMLSVKNRCEQCHREEQLSETAIKDARADRTGTLIPSRWLRFGYYDHAAHPGIDCQFCHDTESNEIAAAPDHERVMIRGIESCTPCHRPSDVETPAGLDANPLIHSQQTTWASDRCTLCHRYHYTRPDSTNVEGAQP